MNRRELIGMALASLAAGHITGCGRAPQINDTEAATPTAPALQTADGPGPQDADAPTEFTTTSSGLKYRVLRKGTGPKPTRSDTALVHYKGTLDDGSEFDSSYKRGEPFPVDMAGGVIDGWLEGLTYVEEGGMIELDIPAQLAYGADGRPGIPPNATLHFTVEVLEVR